MVDSSGPIAPLPPDLTSAEEEKCFAIVEQVGRMLSDVPNEQACNILHHVIEDLFFQREGFRAAAKDPRSPEQIKQETTRIKHRLKEIIRRHDTFHAEEAKKDSALVKLKGDGRKNLPPSR